MTGLISDPEFHSSLTEEYKLSIQVSLDGFSFSIVHLKQKRLLAIHTYPIALSSVKFLSRRFNEWIENNEALRYKYNSTSLIYYSGNFTFIPSDYYDYNKQKHIGNIVLYNTDGNWYTDNYLPHASGNLVFPVSPDFIETVQKLFPGTVLQHPVTILDAERHKLADANQNQLALYFGKKTFSMLLYTGLSLKAINHFTYGSPEDVSFYILSILRKMKLVPEKITLYMAGEILPKDHVYNGLRKFFERAVFITPDIRYNPEIFKAPLHQYITLF